MAHFTVLNSFIKSPVRQTQALALRAFADRLEHGEAGQDLLSISFKAA
jgi:hypothetical protein